MKNTDFCGLSQIKGKKEKKFFKIVVDINTLI